MTCNFKVTKTKGIHSKLLEVLKVRFESTLNIHVNKRIVKSNSRKECNQNFKRSTFTFLANIVKLKLYLPGSKLLRHTGMRLSGNARLCSLGYKNINSIKHIPEISLLPSFKRTYY